MRALHITLRVLSFIIFLVSLVFIIQHWPFGRLMLIGSIVLFVLTYVPAMIKNRR